MNQLLALLECRGRLGIAWLIAANAIDKCIVIEMIGNRWHPLPNELRGVQPRERGFIVRRAKKIKTTGRLLVNQQIGSLLVATVARTSWPSIHVIAESAVYSMSLNRAKC